MTEVRPAGLRRLRALHHDVLVVLELARREHVRDVVRRLLHVALNVHRVARRLRDRQAEVQRDAAGHAAEADEDAPCVINEVHVLLDLVLVCGDDDQSDERTS